MTVDVSALNSLGGFGGASALPVTLFADSFNRASGNVPTTALPYNGWAKTSMFFTPFNSIWAEAQMLVGALNDTFQGLVIQSNGQPNPTQLFPGMIIPPVLIPAVWGKSQSAKADFVFSGGTSNSGLGVLLDPGLANDAGSGYILVVRAGQLAVARNWLAGQLSLIALTNLAASPETIELQAIVSGPNVVLNVLEGGVLTHTVTDASAGRLGTGLPGFQGVDSNPAGVSSFTQWRNFTGKLLP